MKYQIIGKNVSITEGISSAIEKKVSKLDRYLVNPETVECRAVVSAHKNSQKVEITIPLPLVTLRAEVESNDIYSAIDAAIDKLTGQLRKLKTRMNRRNNKAILDKSFHTNVIEETTPLENSPLDEIVRAKSYHLQAMDIDEAIARMEALGHDFFMFIDKEDYRVSVVYARHDGGYGVIRADNELENNDK